MKHRRGDCDCFRFGDIVHYRWSDEYEKGRERVHSAAFVVGMSARSPEEVVLLALSDTQFTLGMSVRPSAKNVHGYRLCTSQCPFNPEYEG